MKVLVLGATGYVGLSVVEHLVRNGMAVLGLSRSASRNAGLHKLTSDYVDADLSNKEEILTAARQCDAAIYAAGPRSSDAESIEMTALAVLSQGLSEGSPLIYLSGCSVYGQSSSKPATEDQPVVENAKARSENLLLSASRLSPIIIRAGLVYGRGGGIIGRLAAHGLKAGEVPIPKDNWRWSVVHVDDLAALIAYFLMHPPQGQVFNASEEGVVTLDEVGEAAAKLAGPGVVLKHGDVMEIAELIGPVAHLLNRHAVINAEAAKRHGWKAQKSFVRSMSN